MEILTGEEKKQNTEQIVGEIFCTKKGILQRIRTNFPLGESWGEKEISYKDAFSEGSRLLRLISIEPDIKNDQLIGIKLILGDVAKEISQPPSLKKENIESFGNYTIVDSIMRVSSQLSRNLSDRTRIQFDWKGITYETIIDSINGKKPTLNSLVKSVCLTYKGEAASLNVYRHINARYFDGAVWHPLNDLRK